MLYNLILTLLLLDGLLLAVVVLLQAGQGGGLASLGGGTTDLVLGGRQAVTILHTGSWWTGGLFLGLSLLLSVLASRPQTGSSEVEQRLRTQPTAPAKVPVPAPLNQQASPPAAPAPGATPPASPLIQKTKPAASHAPQKQAPPPAPAHPPAMR